MQSHLSQKIWRFFVSANRRVYYIAHTGQNRYYGRNATETQQMLFMQNKEMSSRSEGPFMGHL
jgi:hypothetical protein